ncbi:MAG: [FeFe] hydrogenase H-cluster maturation GTPase HydF [Bacteroidales bacterium]|nr:[FeFe] hydrogenase H-cluster maturation GTPase HydF [Bacteroidales bacterium]
MSKVHIGIFGRRNQGKSMLINALAGQNIAIVSDVPGTTTDPVKKSMEIFGIGPCVLVDTAGLDDSGEVGEKRVAKSLESLKIIDIALLLISNNQFGEAEKELIEQFKKYELPFIIVHNKSDIQALKPLLRSQLKTFDAPVIDCSAATKQGLEELIQAIVKTTPSSAYCQENLLDEIIHEGETIVLVMPQDSEAPEGRLILPQVQVIRNILDNKAIAVCLQPSELANYLIVNKPDLVITDSQAFGEVSKIVPTGIPLTGFSIVLARSKGNFDKFIQGTQHLRQLQDGDTILMLESCTHLSSCEDIGRHKLPRLIQQFTGKQLNFQFVAALSPLPSLDNISMAIQCGGCMVTKRQLMNRIKEITDRDIPVSNYGMTLSLVNGIFDRATEVFNK